MPKTTLLSSLLQGQSFLSMLCTMRYGVFVFFSAMVVVMVGALKQWLSFLQVHGMRKPPFLSPRALAPNLALR